MKLICFKIKINSWTNYTGRSFTSYSTLIQKMKFICQQVTGFNL